MKNLKDALRDAKSSNLKQVRNESVPYRTVSYADPDHDFETNQALGRAYDMQRQIDSEALTILPKLAKKLGGSLRTWYAGPGDDELRFEISGIKVKADSGNEIWVRLITNWGMRQSGPALDILKGAGKALTKFKFRDVDMMISRDLKKAGLDGYDLMRWNNGTGLEALNMGYMENFTKKNLKYTEKRLQVYLDFIKEML